MPSMKVGKEEKTELIKHFKSKKMKEISKKEMKEINGGIPLAIIAGTPFHIIIWDAIGEMAYELTQPHDWRSVNGIGLGNWKDKLK